MMWRVRSGQEGQREERGLGTETDAVDWSHSDLLSARGLSGSREPWPTSVNGCFSHSRSCSQFKYPLFLSLVLKCVL